MGPAMHMQGFGGDHGFGALPCGSARVPISPAESALPSAVSLLSLLEPITAYYG